MGLNSSARSERIRELIHEGKPALQAMAIAYKEFGESDPKPRGRVAELLKLADEQRRGLDRAAAASDKAAAVRSALPAGTSRKRVTTANARWSIKAEARERARKTLAETLGRLEEALEHADIAERVRVEAKTRAPKAKTEASGG